MNRPALFGLCALLAAVATAATWMQRDADRWKTWALAEYSLLDQWTRWSPTRPPPDDIVVVGFDDITLDTRPELFDTRRGNAEVLAGIHEAGARVVAVDLFFSNAEAPLGAELGTEVLAWVDAPEPETPPVATDLLERIGEALNGDAALAAALDPERTVLAAHFGRRGIPIARDRTHARGTYGQVVPGPFLPADSTRMKTSMPAFNRRAARLGHITVHTEFGGVRRIPMARRVGPSVFAPFFLQALTQFEGTSRGGLVFDGSQGHIRAGGHALSSDSLLLNWRPHTDFQTFGASEVLEPGFDRSRLRGKLVLVGLVHLTDDTVGTPWGPVPGVYAHALAIDNVRSDRPLQRVSPLTETAFAGLCGVIVLLGLATSRMRMRVAALLASGVLALSVPIALRTGMDVWLGAVGPMSTVALTGGVGVTLFWLAEGASARELRRNFAQYVSDDLIDAMVRDPSLVSLRGQRRDMSVLFSDIRGFTAFSEELEPLVLAEFLQTYLTPMTQAVFDHRGFVDKFIGDAVMALFGAPLQDDHHAGNACRAAIDMHGALGELQPEAQRLGIPLAIGVGINSGEMAVGNMGSVKRFEYTVLGDAVNLASRLEGLTKNYGVFCLVGPSTARTAGGSFRFRRLDRVRVKGKSEPVEIFELLGEGDRHIVELPHIDAWNRGFEAYLQGDFSTALAAFADCGDDPVAALFVDRIHTLGGTAPQGWDGVFVFDTK